MTHDPTRLARLAYRASHRGVREMDMILGAFLPRLPGLSPEGVDAFEALLAESDPDLMAWVTGARPPPPEHAALVADLREAALAIGRAGAASR